METDSYANNSPGTVSAVFKGKSDVEKAYSALIRLGFHDHEISLLMSDETLDKQANASDEGIESGGDVRQNEKDTSLAGRSRKLVAHAIISLTSKIKLPDLGNAIAKYLTGDGAKLGTEKEQSRLNAIRGWYDTYEDGVREGGIIVSVDPKNKTERDAIIREFRINHGRDILGDDGYTELQ
jgi:hypothetical protein